MKDSLRLDFKDPTRFVSGGETPQNVSLLITLSCSR